MNIRASILIRLRIAFLLMVLFATLILVKIFHIQLIEGDKWRKIASETTLRYMDVKATRGNIFSDDGTLLATSLPFYRLGFDPVAPPEDLFNAYVDTLAWLVSNFFREKSPLEWSNELRQARAEGKRYKLLSKQYVTYKQKKQIEQWPLLKEGRITGGIVWEKTEKRFRPFEDLARRTIGFILEDDTTDILKGRGLEYSFHKELSGTNGKALFQKIAGGFWKPVGGNALTQPQNGMDIHTTLDIEIQEFAHQVLKEALEKHQANYGCIIFMEVKTGEIKCMVNLGESEGTYIEDYNYAVGSQGVTEPGSTWKLVTMMAALEEDSDLELTDSVQTGDGKYLFYEDCIMTDATPVGYGMISVQEVFERSSNIGVSKIVFKTFADKPEKLIEYIEKWKFHQPLPFQMEGVGTPFVTRPKGQGWSGCSLPWLAIGYEVKISPLQMLTFYNAVANNGKMIQPIIVNKITRGNQVIKRFFARTLNEKICSQKTLEKIRTMMEGVVLRGTAKSIQNNMFSIAGKTGTTQKLKFGRYTQSYYTSFCGYFPVDNPKFSGIVVVDEPKIGGMYGGSVAAPIFKQVAQKIYIKRVHLPLQKDSVAHHSAPKSATGYSEDIEYVLDEFDLDYENKNEQDWVKVSTAADTVVLSDTPTNAGDVVPDVRGMTLRDALFLLENKGMQVRVIGKGRVLKQSIPAGRSVKRGMQIVVVLG
ncbi:MAG: transpeptidase family protein [Cytophagales bacterium]|nr:transpeptidase family protein [Cytophagales bacterium]MDW8383415.1 penicillin-binding protein [Flammeovirgaceae bacterium]